MRNFRKQTLGTGSVKRVVWGPSLEQLKALRDKNRRAPTMC